MANKLLLEKNVKQHFLRGNTEKIAEIVKKAGGWTKPCSRDSGKTPLHYLVITWNQSVSDLSDTGLAGRTFIAHKDWLDVVDNDGNTLAHTAAKSHRPKEMLEFLGRLGTPLDEKNKKGDTPLLILARRANSTNREMTGGFSYLMEKGCDINATNLDGNDAFSLALTYRSMGALLALLDVDAISFKKRFDSSFPLSGSKIYSPEAGVSFPGVGALLRDIDEQTYFKLLLENSSSGISQSGKENAPTEKDERLGKQIHRFVEFIGKDKFSSFTPIAADIAKSGGKASVLSLLHAAGDEHRKDILSAALQQALAFDDAGAVDFWMEHGADVSWTDEEGKTFAEKTLHSLRLNIAETIIEREGIGFRIKGDDTDFILRCLSVPLDGADEESFSSVSRLQAKLLVAKSANSQTSNRHSI